MIDVGLIDIFLGWVPMLLLLAVFYVLVRSITKRSISSSGKRHIDLVESLLEESRANNNNLIKIIDRLDERISKLEGHSD